MESYEFVIDVQGRRLPLMVGVPPKGKLAPEPALLVTTGGTRQAVFREEISKIPAEVFLAAGHYVAAFDLPNHGERIDPYGANIEGLCAAYMGGEDPFTMFVADGKAVIDACLARGLGAPGKIVACGTSRAGYCALRLAAADPRISGVAGLAPVTDWRPLREWAAVKDCPEVAALSLDHWAASFAGRAVYLVIGNHDDRVGTDCCVRLALRIFAAEHPTQPGSSRHELHIVPEQGHSLANEWRAAGVQYLLRLVG